MPGLETCCCGLSHTAGQRVSTLVGWAFLPETALRIRRIALESADLEITEMESVLGREPGRDKSI